MDVIFSTSKHGDDDDDDDADDDDDDIDEHERKAASDRKVDSNRTDGVLHLYSLNKHRHTQRYRATSCPFSKENADE